MTQIGKTPDEVLADIRLAVERNFNDPFGPYRMPDKVFTCDELDPIEPYDLERAKEPEFQTKMRQKLRDNGMHSGMVARQLRIDVRLVTREAQKMRFEDPAIRSQLRELLAGPMHESHGAIAQQFRVAEADVKQMAHEMLGEDPAFLELLESAK